MPFPAYFCMFILVLDMFMVIETFDVVNFAMLYIGFYFDLLDLKCLSLLSIYI